MLKYNIIYNDALKLTCHTLYTHLSTPGYFTVPELFEQRVHEQKILNSCVSTLYSIFQVHDNHINFVVQNIITSSCS
jgi:hypothetical protein